MKIFIVGAEGSGKTVFLAMLSRYLNEQHGGLVLEPADYPTSQYIVEVQQTLEQGEWPASTRMGQSFVMKYKFGIVGKTNHALLMHDAAGQDLRSLMLSEELEDLSTDDRAALAAAKASPGDHMSTLRNQIHNADALVYLLDLESFLANGNVRAQNEHCWLLKTFLAHPRWKDKKRIVLLSKKDKYEALLSQSGNDVRKCIRAHLPSFYSISHYLDQKNVLFAAISSVAAETFIDEDGTPSRRPCRPFRPGDMLGIAKFLADIANNPSSLPRPKVARRPVLAPPHPTGNGFIAMLFALMLPAVLMGLGLLGYPAEPSAAEGGLIGVGLLTFLPVICVNPWLSVELKYVPIRAWFRAVVRQILAAVLGWIGFLAVTGFIAGYRGLEIGPAAGADASHEWLMGITLYLCVIIAMATAVHWSLSASAKE